MPLGVDIYTLTRRYMPRRGKRFIRFISCACGCNRLLLDLDKSGHIRKHIKGHQNKVRQYKGSKNPCWKNGIIIDTQGYAWVYKPSHPYAVRGRVRLHRIIMEKHIGRYLESSEDVHHINGITTENLFSNLMLLSHGEHACLTMTEYHKQKIIGQPSKRI